MRPLPAPNPVIAQPGHSSVPTRHSRESENPGRPADAPIARAQPRHCPTRPSQRPNPSFPRKRKSRASSGYAHYPRPTPSLPNPAIPASQPVIPAKAKIQSVQRMRPLPAPNPIIAQLGHPSVPPRHSRKSENPERPADRAITRTQPRHSRKSGNPERPADAPIARPQSRHCPTRPFQRPAPSFPRKRESRASSRCAHYPRPTPSLPNPAIPASQPVIPAKAGIQSIQRIRPLPLGKSRRFAFPRITRPSPP